MDVPAPVRPIPNSNLPTHLWLVHHITCRPFSVNTCAMNVGGMTLRFMGVAQLVASKKEPGPGSCTIFPPFKQTSLQHLDWGIEA